jgi:hypothetical protein
MAMRRRWTRPEQRGRRRWGAAVGLLLAGALVCALLGLARAQAVAAATPTPFIRLPVCKQHPQVCPVDAATWAGAANAWQTTGRNWRRHSATADTYPNYTVIWQWSEPYNGANPAYAGYRQNPYADFSANPAGQPFDGGAPPAIYDWERWLADGANWRLYQYGVNDSAAASYVGLGDCTSGVLYPVVNSAHPYVVVLKVVPRVMLQKSVPRAVGPRLG